MGRGEVNSHIEELCEGLPGAWPGPRSHSSCLESWIFNHRSTQAEVQTFDSQMLRWGFEFWTRCKPCLYFLSWISDLPSRTCLPDSSYFFPLNKWSCWPASLTASLACAFISWHSFHFPHFICAFLSSHLLAYFLSCLVPVPLVLNEGEKIHGGWGRLICLTGWHCCFWWVLVRSSWSPKWQQIKSLPLRPVCWGCGTREQAGQPQRKVLSHSLEAGWLRSRCLGIDSPWGPAGHIPGLSLVSGAFWQCLALLSLWIHQSPWSLPSSSPCVCVHVPIFPFFIRTRVLLDSGPPYFSVISTYLLLLPNKVTFWGAEVRTSTYESVGVLQFNTPNIIRGIPAFWRNAITTFISFYIWNDDTTGVCGVFGSCSPHCLLQLLLCSRLQLLMAPVSFLLKAPWHLSSVLTLCLPQAEKGEAKSYVGSWALGCVLSLARSNLPTLHTLWAPWVHRSPFGTLLPACGGNLCFYFFCLLFAPLFFTLTNQSIIEIQLTCNIVFASSVQHNDLIFIYMAMVTTISQVHICYPVWLENFKFSCDQN